MQIRGNLSGRAKDLLAVEKKRKRKRCARREAVTGHKKKKRERGWLTSKGRVFIVSLGHNAYMEILV